MARNWGGTGIEKYLFPGEAVRARFSNYFLTDSRIGKYRTLSSTFEFLNLSDLYLKEISSTGRRSALLVSVVIIAVLNFLAYLMFHSSPLQVFALIFVIFGTYAYIYVVLVKFAHKSISIESRNKGVKWTIRSYGQKKGYTFLSEVREALGFTPDT